MTNETNKLRALFLAALMVLSITVGSIAFAGSAAAAVNDVSGAEISTPNEQTYNLSDVTGNQTHTIEFDVTSDNVDNDLVEVDLSETYDAGFDVYLTDVTADTNDVSDVELSESEEVLTFNVTDSGTHSVGVNLNLNVSDAEEDTRITHYISAGDESTSVSYKTYEVGSTVFDSNTAEDKDVFAGEIVTVKAGDDKDVEVWSLDSDGYRDTRVKNLATDPGNVVNIDTSDLAAGTNYDIVMEGGVIDNMTVFDLGLDAEAVETDITTDDAAEADITSDDPNGAYTAYLYDSDDSEIDSTTGTFDGSGDDTVSFDSFAEGDEGDYHIEVEHDDTGITAQTGTITVGEAQAGEMALDQTSVNVAQGDVAEITLNFENDAETGMLVIGEYADNNYQANISVDSEGEDQVTVAFNTLEAGNGGDAWVVGDSDATITYDERTSDSFNDNLDTGDYLISVASGATSAQDTIDESDNVGTLWVEERSTDAMNVWTASGSNADDIESAEDVSAAVEDGLLTQTDSVAMEDDLVLEISASGLSGFMVNEDTEDGDVTDEFVSALNASDYGEFNIVIEQVNPGSNQDAEELDLAAAGSDITDDLRVFYNADADSYYVIVNEDDLDDELDSLEDGEEYEASFELKDSWLLQYDHTQDDADENYQTVSSELAFADRTASFDVTDVEGEDYVVAEAAADQSISGTTNIAPGSEVSIRAAGTGDARFVQEVTELVVAEDGSFAGTFDFSEQSDGDEFDVSLRGDLRNDDDGDNFAADGLIQEAQPEETTTEETTEETTTEETTTETTTEEPADTTTEAPADTTTEAPEETPTETPGFTMGLALVALLGAALLALRRN